jgi:hypothetical protein
MLELTHPSVNMNGELAIAHMNFSVRTIPFATRCVQSFGLVVILAPNLINRYTDANQPMDTLAHISFLL